jgi:hypothetical protein
MVVVVNMKIDRFDDCKKKPKENKTQSTGSQNKPCSLEQLN